MSKNDGQFKEGNQAALKHGGAGAVKALQLGLPFKGLAEQVEQVVYDELETQGRMAMVRKNAVRLQTAGRGTIVGVSSVAGDRGRAGQPAYNASKAALSSYLESLYHRLWRHGVRVVDVRPGPVHTPMTAHLDDLSGAISAELAAESILAAAHRGARVAYIPAKWRLIMFVIRSIPAWILRRLKI